MKTISFYTLGCRLNQSETATIENSFKDDAFKIVGFDQPADIAVINTCTVTENGDNDARRLVLKANRLNPHVKVALIGCQAQIQKEKLLQLPNVNWVVGNGRKMDLKNILQSLDSPTPQVITPTITKENFTIDFTSIDNKHTRANLKIQDGCDFFCRFCEIPYARGRARSRVFDDILKEANALVAAGYQEIVLTGINIGTYENHDKNLIDVIEALENISALKRIRISSIEPTTVPEKLIYKMSLGSKLCRYLHLPLQSGSDKILQSMKRKYSVKEYNNFILNAKSLVKEICIGTDVIVGFPGETEEEFERTYNYLLDAPIDYFHVFSYSARHLAKSKTFDEPISKYTINKRSALLRDLSNRKKRMFHESLKNTSQEILFERNKRAPAYGRTDHFIRVEVETNLSLRNSFRKVLIISTTDEALKGSLI